MVLPMHFQKIECSVDPQGLKTEEVEEERAFETRPADDKESLKVKTKFSRKADQCNRSG